jgi:hypothetical protein
MNTCLHRSKIVIGVALVVPILLPNDASAGSGPTGFTENKGQIHDQFRKPNPSVLYLFNGAGMNVQLRNNGFAYDTYTMEEGEGGPTVGDPAHGIDEMGRPIPGPIPTTYRFHRIDLRFVNGNPGPEILREGESEDYTNNYTDVTGEAGATFVRSYSTITYRDVWPDIDVRFNASADGFKYDVIVRPNGNLSDVRFSVEGSEIRESLKGSMVISWADGELEESIPESWVEEDWKKSLINVGYAIGRDGTFGFRTEERTEGSVLVIDPSPIIWGTYYGGAGIDVGTGTALDGSNNAYVTGHTNSAMNMATAGSFDATYNQSSDGFIVKMNEAGTRLWGTYFGGASTDIANDIASSQVGVLAVVGYTSSTSGIATTGTFQSTATDNYDGFAILFNPNGTRIWGTYYAGTGNFPNQEEIRAVSIAPDGRIAIAGWSTSIAGIATPGTENPTAGHDLLAVLSGSGQRLWATYVGNDPWMGGLPSGVAFIGNDRLAVTGTTYNTSGIATNTLGRHDGTFNGGADAYLINYNALNGLRVWGTYFGGSGNDIVLDLAYAGLSRVAICGRTDSNWGIASTGAHQTSFAGGMSDGFVAVFNTSNGSRSWGSYHGTSLNDQLTSVDGTENGHIALGGIQHLHDLNSPGQSFCLDFSTGGTLYYQPNLALAATNCAVSANPHGMMVTGTTTYPIAINAPMVHQTLYGGGSSDAFLYHLHYSLVPLGATLQAPDPSPRAQLKVRSIGEHVELSLSGEAGPLPTELMIIDASGRIVLRRSWDAHLAKLIPIHDADPGTYCAIAVFTDGAISNARFVIP